MASIIVDGPRNWALDVLDRKLGRAFAAATGLMMLAAVFLIHPGPARLACAVFAGLLLLRAAAPRRPQVTIDDLAQVELLVMETREHIDSRVSDARQDVVERIRDVRTEVEIICDRLAG